MGMFDNYNNIDPNYIPNNTTCKEITYIEIDNSNPKKAYDAKGRFVGYTWQQGDTFDLLLSIDLSIKVNSDIIFTESGAAPAINTVAEIGQQAYNIKDIKSWTCIAIDTIDNEKVYTWVEDEYFTYPSNGKIPVKLSPDMTGKNLSLCVYNFRWNLVHEFSVSESTSLICSVDSNLTNKFIPGVYYCVMKIDGDVRKTIRKFEFIVE